MRLASIVFFSGLKFGLSSVFFYSLWQTCCTNLTCCPECFNYKSLTKANRAEGYSAKYRRALCDKKLSKGWYRFTGEAGNQMPDFCVAKLRCGAHAPGWLNSSHPSVAAGIINTRVCFHWGSNCCYWSTEIRVRNCGTFFVYELHPTRYCSLRYCGNKRLGEVPVAKLLRHFLY